MKPPGVTGNSLISAALRHAFFVHPASLYRQVLRIILDVPYDRRKAGAIWYQL